MAFLSDTDSAYLREQFATVLAGDVELRLFTEADTGLYVPGRQTCETCGAAQELLEELAALSEHLRLKVVDVREDPEAASRWGVNRLPTLSVAPANGTPDAEDAGVRFVGLPDGYEFTSLIETIASAGSAAGHGLSAETVEALAQLPAPVELKVFVTPT
ncbi:MAG TPA: hypothetical protein VFW71_04095 [Actinomycetota bacterium]|nr:hypothetical protein [Actinomycetota bacterium]